MSDLLTELQTDTLTTEEILSQSRAFLEAVLHNLNLSVIVLDGSFRITFFNKDQASLFSRMGVEPSMLSIIGADIASVFPILNPLEWEEARQHVGHSSGFSRQRVAWPTADPVGHFHLSVQALEGGASAGAVCTTEDITGIVKLERQLVREERMALVGQMSIALNHEINNPLTVILGRAEAMLQAPNLEMPVVAGLSAIRVAGQRIERVTRKLRLMEEIQLTSYLKDGPMMVDFSDAPIG